MFSLSYKPQSLAATGETSLRAKVPGAEVSIAGVDPGNALFIVALVTVVGVGAYCLGSQRCR